MKTEWHVFFFCKNEGAVLLAHRDCPHVARYVRCNVVVNFIYGISEE